MRSYVRALPLALALAAASAPRALHAQDTTPPRGVRLGLTYGSGVTPGVIVGTVKALWGDSIQAMIQRDLDGGDRVTVIGMPGTPAAGAITQVGAGVSYAVWKTLGAAAALQLSVANGALHVALHDVAKGAVLQVHDFPLPSSTGSAEWRLAVHGASDEVERWITGTRGIAATRVLFVSGKQVHIIDSDGWGNRVLTTGSTALSPAWHPSGKFFAFSTLTQRGWRIEFQDLPSGSPRALGTTPQGLNITPTFSSDGAWLSYAHGDEEGTDLFVTPMSDGNAGGDARRVTIGRGTDNVSPSFSPEGRRLAFTSGRVGHPEVYLADVDGTNVEPLVTDVSAENGYRSNPDWSPDGRQIVFQQQIGGIFQLMITTLRERSVRQLTSEGRNEDPSWAPDGRHVVFSTTRTGVRELFVLDVESGRARQLTHGAGARLPAWSPALVSSP